MPIFETVRKNKEWVFSGIGVAVPIAVSSYLLKYRDPESSIAQAAIFTGFVIAATFIFLLIFLQIIFFLSRRRFFVYLKYKLLEILAIMTGQHKEKRVIPFSIQYNCFELLNFHEGQIDLLKRIVCLNQGEIAQFSYFAGERHKAIKDEVSSNAPNVDKLIKACKCIEDELYDRAIGVFEKNHPLIMEYFTGRTETLPRVCVKIREGDKITDFYRHREEYSYSAGIHENSGAEYVLTQGNWFLCNDIPAAIQNDLYNNPRIDPIKVRRQIAKPEKFDNFQDWIDCWVPNKMDGGRTKQPSNESCYMSTLIIPMTLIRNDLLPEFKDHFHIPKSQKPTDISRAIYGLLCFDHCETNYFNEELDVKVGYMLADLLSLYLINTYQYINFSKSYNKAQDLIDTSASRR